MSNNAMRSINKVTLLGRLTEPPEVRATNGKTVCNFVVETTESWMGRNGEQSRTVIHSCTAFGPVAETVRGASVGGHIYVEGALRNDRESEFADAVEVVCFVAIPVAGQQQVAA